MPDRSVVISKLSRSCDSLVALLPGTNFEGQSVEMKEPKNGDWTINAGASGHPSLSLLQAANFTIGRSKN